MYLPKNSIGGEGSLANARRYLPPTRTSITGILLAITVGLAVLAAQGVGKALRRERATLEGRRAHAVRLDRARTPSSWIIAIGDLPPRVMPWVLAAIWTMLLIRVLHV
jgi:hypothetical protein